MTPAGALREMSAVLAALASDTPGPQAATAWAAAEDLAILADLAEAAS
jgi:hypothetical protein